MTKKYAAVAITRNGITQALRLGEHLEHTDLYLLSKYTDGLCEEEGRHFFSGPVKELLPALFSRYEGLILFFSLGAVVRLIAPLLQDKRTDPAIVAVDERGEHAISVLSGHLGGANTLTLRVAEILNSRPVITTASDVQGTIAADLLGQEFGWTAESYKHMKLVSSAIVNGEEVAFIQECGERNWLPSGSALPEHVKLYNHAEETAGIPLHAVILVTDRILEEKEYDRLLTNGVLYRPKSLVLGIGCNRGTTLEELEAVLEDTFSELNLALESVLGVATINLKADEQGLLALCRNHGWELTVYTAEQLNTIPVPQPSETVFRVTGAYGVCEPAALLFSGAKEWLLPKRKSGNVTLSIARIPSEEWSKNDEQ
ncbi:cobalt-precorrin 5A hydrolase [Paenibacillus sp. sgz500958]|uniref:cobalt-precorrin 5A hydrolase n=1 Tax=Paenibacillus sp. sgz500958 TaxID=3242475 RepID=UPI0036D267AB